MPNDGCEMHICKSARTSVSNRLAEEAIYHIQRLLGVNVRGLTFSKIIDLRPTTAAEKSRCGSGFIPRCKTIDIQSSRDAMAYYTCEPLSRMAMVKPEHFLTLTSK